MSKSGLQIIHASLVVVLLLDAKPTSSQASWGAGPLAVSPGGTVSEELTTEACPTFHWAETKETEGYELAVYRVEGIDATRLEAVERLGRDFGRSLGAPALRQILPSGVGSWTPSLDRCLEPAGRYVWTVAPLQGGVASEGERAQPLYFVVRERSRLERILGQVVERLIAEGELTAEDALQLAAWGLDGSAPPPAEESLVEEIGEPVSSAAPASPVRALVAEPDHLLSSIESPLISHSSFYVDGINHEWGLRARGGENGIEGVAEATFGISVGVHGRSQSAAGRGVVGTAFASSGPTYGVLGEVSSTSGIAVYGGSNATTGNAYGVYGLSNSSSGRGVYGRAQRSTGTTFGVYGESLSPSGTGVLGYSVAGSGATNGIYGLAQSTSGRGVYGFATAASGTTYGLYGRAVSNAGNGVYGHATGTLGATYGVFGRSNSSSGRGVYGFASSVSGTTYGVLAQSLSPNGWDFYAAGSNMNYGPFTGGHEARLDEGTGEIVPGLVVSVTGRAEMREENGVISLSSTLPTVKLACRRADPAVFGVLVGQTELPSDHWYRASEDERFATVNALGEGRVWVTDANGLVRAGDYLTTSHVPGYAQRQDDDHLHSYTLGKAIENVAWDQVTDTIELGGVSYKKVLLAVVYTSG